MDQKTENLCLQVLIACRTELCQLFPGLNLAFGYLPLRIAGDNLLATDGVTLCASPKILSLYAEHPALLRRGMLHALLHCLYLHFRLPDRVDVRKWGIACDLWVENLIASLQEPRLEAVEIPEKFAGFLPETIYGKLENEDLDALEALVSFDDHGLWPKKITPELRHKWEGALSGGGDLGKGNRGSKTTMEEEELPPVPMKKPYDYRKYLRKFTVSREEMETDEESFDYIYYDLGMTRYGDLPLIEPLEYKEVWRLDELAIAIDTSGSCSRETVARFLNETYAILSSQENFFHKMKVVFFQCDCVLQDSTVIESPDAWGKYASRLKIKGRGGTDFRPVFREIEKMRAAGELKKPRALLYFTDGDGIYPTEVPDYETVFVLAGKPQGFELVPPWATKLVL